MLFLLQALLVATAIAETRHKMYDIEGSCAEYDLEGSCNQSNTLSGGCASKYEVGCSFAVQKHFGGTYKFPIIREGNGCSVTVTYKVTDCNTCKEHASLWAEGTGTITQQAECSGSSSL